MRPLSSVGTMPTSQVALSRGGTGARPGGKHGCVTFCTHRSRYRVCRAACRRRPWRVRWYFCPAFFCRSRFASAAHPGEQYRQRPSHRRHNRNSPPQRGHRRSNRSTRRQQPQDWTSSEPRAIQNLVGASCLVRGHPRGLGALTLGPRSFLGYCRLSLYATARGDIKKPTAIARARSDRPPALCDDCLL